MILSFFVFICNLLLALRYKKQFQIFGFLMLFSCFYYGFLGPIYWLQAKDGEFVGVDWSPILPDVSILFSVACFEVLLGVLIASSFSKWNKNFASSKEVVKLPFSFYLFFSLAMFSCIFVIISFKSRNAFFLTAYQFSDIMVSVLAYGFAVRPKSKIMLFSLFFYIYFAIIVGFRYKLALTIFPLWYLYSKNESKNTKVLTYIGPMLVLVLFSIMTIARQKFSGLDYSAIAEANNESFLYGLFAETNIVFGTASIIDYVLPHGHYVFFTPFVDAIKELIPKFLIGDRDSGEQIWYVLEGLQTEQGYNSATTYPFFGEYLMMFGYYGYFIMNLALGWIVVSLFNLTKRLSVTKDIFNAGIGLVTVIFGYYYVSRGYTPQFFKSVVFVALPFFIMIHKTQLLSIEK